MPNGDVLRQLFQGYVKGDDTSFRSAAQDIIEEERHKNHRLLADDLEKILIRGTNRNLQRTPNLRTLEVPKDRERGFPLLDINEYSYDWNRLILRSETLASLEQIALEYRKRDLLAASGLKPKQRLLFYGPPGCGKTLAAKVLAGVLEYPLVTVRFDAIVSSYLGETATNLRKVFEFLEQRTWVVLFDEFDAIGKERDNPLEHGELKRVVNTLLQLMDAFRGQSLLIAATNHEGVLDSALWRRFEAVIPFLPPTQQDRVLLLRLFLNSFDYSELNLEQLAKRLSGVSGADLEWLAIEIARRAVLDGRRNLQKKDFETVLPDLKRRRGLERKYSSSSNSSGQTHNPQADTSNQ